MGGLGTGFPAETTSFVGRRQELADAKRQLSVARLLTLTGPGGVGKTRLAARLTQQVTKAFPDGVYVVSMAALRDGGLVPHAVADELGIRDAAGRPPMELLLEHLSGRRSLLVIDNCEHLLDACASLIGELLAKTERVRVLATSRHRIGLIEEYLLSVPPLAAPPAARLFADRAAAVRPGFEIGDDNREAVARLCRRLDGLPLAIELAAVRMQALSAGQLDERMEQRYRLLTAGSPVAPPRHQTLRAAVDWSHDLCTEEEKLAWARMSVFPGSFDLDAAESVCAADGLERDAVLDTVAGLMEKSILFRDDAGGTARYRMLATLREYGLERLAALDETEAARLRHRDHFLPLAARLASRWFGPDQPEILARLRAEQDNLRAALGFCLNSPGAEHLGRRLVGDLWFYGLACGAWIEMRDWWHRLLLRSDGKPAGVPTSVVWLSAALPTIHSRSAAVLVAGPAAEPTEHLRSFPSVKPLGELLAEGRGTVAEQLGFHVINRVEMAATMIFHGRPKCAVSLCTEAIACCEAQGDQWVRSYLLRTLAMAQRAVGDYGHAAETARRCLRLGYVVTEPYALGWTLEVLADIAACDDDAERAAILHGAARRIWYDIGHDPLAPSRRDGRTKVGERLAREALGEHRYEQASRRGYELETPAVLDFAAGGEPAAVAGRRFGTEGPLTARELQVAGLIAAGLTNRQIAETLVISQRTAEGHVEHILAKLEAGNRSQVAAWFSSSRPAGPPP